MSRQYRECRCLSPKCKKVEGETYYECVAHMNTPSQGKQMKFIYKQKVEVISGFYKGQWGTVTGYRRRPNVVQASYTVAFDLHGDPFHDVIEISEKNLAVARTIESIQPEPIKLTWFERLFIQ